MKIINLNTWGGRAGKERLLAFLKYYAKDTDVFCLQEVWAAPYEHLEGFLAGGLAIKHDDIMTEGMQEISEALSEYSMLFHPHNGDNYGLMMLVNKTLNIKEQGEVFVHKYRGFIPEGDIGKHARNIQYATIETERGLFTVINFHGLWNGEGKTDSEDRLEQSKKILAFLKELAHPYLLCGDFNLLPDTESIRMLERNGLRNLIKEHGITSTRTSLYTKPEKYADYVFASPGVQVKTFSVLPEEVSDHAALCVELEF